MAKLAWKSLNTTSKFNKINVQKNTFDNISVQFYHERWRVTCLSLFFRALIDWKKDQWDQ